MIDAIEPGQRIVLPSGTQVQVLRRVVGDGDTRVFCGYLHDNGALRDAGWGERNRVTFVERWLLRHARPAS